MNNPHDPISRKKMTSIRSRLTKRDSEIEEEKNPTHLPLEERPKSKATPMQPSVPPLKLTPKIKAQPMDHG